MRLFVTGANGGIGRQVVFRALLSGHRVTAFVRRAEGLPPDPRLTVVTGAVADEPDAVRKAVPGHDAVICALGNPLWLKGRKGPAIVARATGHLVAAMRDGEVERIVMPLAWGAGASRHGASPLVRTATRVFIRRDYRDFDAAERMLEESELNWTVAYFGALTDASAGAHWSASAEIRTPANLAISRADVAQFLLTAAEHNAFARARAVLSGPSDDRKGAVPR
ncbi:SDR family oxidoreductase [Streptomyces sp. NBC_00885]|uniref:NAD(P)-dependent oxidoreductase n=1 Tax=Streptomyces sp. NBC_00885 TaxID=2975857 RepID=UPI00386C63C2|nr:SDR family oxidoreductase [Streptomyces sp. NBC_00885]